MKPTQLRALNEDHLQIISLFGLTVTGIKNGHTSDGNTSDNCHEKSILQNGCHKESNHMLTIMKCSLNHII